MDFNTRGLLVPNSNIVVTLDAFRNVFVNDFPMSKTREKIFENYIKYSNELKQILGLSELKQWIDGSYVTKTINPKDVDLVSFVDENIYLQKENELARFREYNWFDLNIDAYILVERQSFIFESDKMYWLNHFSKTRKNLKTGKRMDKGFIEINY